jgi:hypothetical protein
MFAANRDRGFQPLLRNEAFLKLLVKCVRFIITYASLLLIGGPAAAISSYFLGRCYYKLEKKKTIKKSAV